MKLSILVVKRFVQSVIGMQSRYAASESCPVHIYDTIGFETGGVEAQDQLQKLIQERKEAAAKHSLDDPEHCQENLHMVWWVIDVIAGGRFNPEHIQQVSKLFRDSGIPIIMVLNKCDTLKDNVEEVEKKVRSTCPWAKHIVQVVTDPRLGPARLSCECGSTNIFISASTRSYICSVCHWVMQVPPFPFVCLCSWLEEAISRGVNLSAVQSNHMEFPHLTWAFYVLRHYVRQTKRGVQGALWSVRTDSRDGQVPA